MTTYMGPIEASRASLLLTERVYALDEPWRSRFLNYIANCALITDADIMPSRTEVLAWLRDEQLHEQIRLMLRAWTNHSR